MSWKLLIRLSKIYGGRVWWLWMGGVVFGGWRVSVLMYRLISRSSSVAKSCVGEVGGICGYMCGVSFP